MGGAFVAVSDDANALYFNPGGLYQVNGVLFQGNYALMSMDRMHYEGSLAVSSEGLGVLGLSVVGFGVSDIDGRDVAGNPTDSFGDTELAVNLAYGREIIPHLGIGGSFKYLNQSLEDSKANGFGFDAGIHSRFEFAAVISAVSAGYAMSNLGSKLTWDTESDHEDEVASTTRYGFAVEASPGDAVSVLVAYEGSTTGEADTVTHLGAEVWVKEIAAVRAGMNGDDLTFGLSARAGIVRFDFAYAPDALDEGATKYIGIHLGS